jgi:predicted house-cleaning NTP pyrophosphatase (Maf/HAM1 superfamily)
MRAYGPDEIDAYVATGDPLDKAGAYAIQHPVFNPVARLEGCYLSVMGLSLCELILLLQCLDVPTRADRAKLAAAHQGYACPVFDRLDWAHT